jgi:hypothetical protein
VSHYATLSGHAGCSPWRNVQLACGCQVRVRQEFSDNSWWTDIDFDSAAGLCGVGRDLFEKWNGEPVYVAGRTHFRALQRHLETQLPTPASVPTCALLAPAEGGRDGS